MEKGCVRGACWCMGRGGVQSRALGYQHCPVVPFGASGLSSSPLVHEPFRSMGRCQSCNGGIVCPIQHALPHALMSPLDNATYLTVEGCKVLQPLECTAPSFVGHRSQKRTEKTTARQTHAPEVQPIDNMGKHPHHVRTRRAPCPLLDEYQANGLPLEALEMVSFRGL